MLGNTLFIRRVGHSQSEPSVKGGELVDVFAQSLLHVVPGLRHQGSTVLLGLLLIWEEFSPVGPVVFVLALRVVGGNSKAHGGAVCCCLGKIGDLDVELVKPVGVVIARIKVCGFPFGNIVSRG